MLRYPNTEVLYVPHPDAFGEDQFSFTAYDCGGSAVRKSLDRFVSVDITASEDAPVISCVPEPAANTTHVTVAPGEAKYFTFTSTDIDQAEIQVFINSPPTKGMLINPETSESFGAGVSLLSVATPMSTVSSAVTPIMYKPNDCASISVNQDEFRVRAVSASGLVTLKTISVEYDCAELAVEYSFYEPSSIAYGLGYVYGAVGLLLCAFFLHFQLKYKMVRSSPRTRECDFRHYLY